MLTGMTVQWSCQEERNVDESVHFERAIPAAIEQLKTLSTQSATTDELSTPSQDAPQSMVKPANDASVLNECFDEYGPEFCYGDFTKTFVVRTKGCPVKITATWTYCYENIDSPNTIFVVKEYNISFVEYDPNNSECVEFFDTLISHIIEAVLNGEDLSKVIVDNLIRDFVFRAELKWDSAFIDWYWSYSPPPSCQNPNPDANTIVEYYDGNCGQWCLSFIKDQSGEIKKLVPVKLKCGKLCCVRRSTFCEDLHTNEMVRETTIEALETCTYQEPDPYPGCLFLGECLESCDH